MNFPSILVIAIGLGLDAFSVAISVGAIARIISYVPVFRLSFFFGMLALVGGKMIAESFNDEQRFTLQIRRKG